MSFSVDQFMQVKCTFQLTSESDSSESIVTNNEQIRLCTSVNLDDNNAALIVMVCTNETGNNHILAYYIERRQHNNNQQQQKSAQKSADTRDLLLASASIDQSQAAGVVSEESTTNENSSAKRNIGGLTFANLAAQSTRLTPTFDTSDPRLVGPQPVISNIRKRVRTKPRIIVKQIYYHDYNEDIVAICLNKAGTKLVLVNASSTIYVVPIKNILLNLHAQQLRSSQGRSMYFYDANILQCAQLPTNFADPVDVIYWESPSAATSTEDKSATIIMASHDGKLIFVNVDEKRVVGSTSVGEPIKSLQVLRDRYSHSLLITCKSLNQYRQVLELLSGDRHSGPQTVVNLPPPSTSSLSSYGFRRKTQAPKGIQMNSLETQVPSWSTRPLPVKPLSHQAGGASSVAASALQRVLLPSASRFGSQASLMSMPEVARERPLSLVGHQEPNLVSLVDVLGPNSGSLSATQTRDPRLLRFYSDKQYFYQPQRPQVICKLDSLEPDELITQLLLTDRFIALTTDRDRCIVNSRNCCKLKNALNMQQQQQTHQRNQQDLSPLVKEITFNHEEKIMLLLRSPVVNDPDNIIDSFLLVTTRSIYSIEARHGCRELFINLIDSHLAIKRTLFMSRPRPELEQAPFTLGRMFTSASESHLATWGQQHSNDSSGEHGRRESFRSTSAYAGAESSRNAESNLLINSFLQHRDAYERVCHDSQAFSTLFKVELASLYEAYADRLLQRGQLELANRFFQMASFDHQRILGKYIRVGAYKETIDYVRGLLDDESGLRRMLGESERIELSKMAFECLLAKTIVERTKVSLYRARSSRKFRHKMLEVIGQQLGPLSGRKCQPPDIGGQLQLQQSPQPPSSALWTSPALRGLNQFSLCEHSPRGQDAKLSATTIVPNGHDEEDTLTSHTGGSNRMMRNAGMDHDRLECEKSLLHFMRHLMPSSMFEYTIDQLLDFDLIEFIDLITQTDIQILSFLKMVTRYRDEDRLVFRAGKFEPLLERLARVNQADLMKVRTSQKREFLEFLTSPRVTRALVKDIGLTCEYYGYQHTLVQFRKFSYAALRHLDTYRQLVEARGKLKVDFTVDSSSSGLEVVPTTVDDDIHDDDNANDGLSFSKHKAQDKSRTRMRFSTSQRQNVESIFVEFLTACLDESMEDSSRLWYNYINFFLNYVGNLDELQMDILRLVEGTGDCRVAISLYRAIHRDELLAKGANKAKNQSKKKSAANQRGPFSNFNSISRNIVDGTTNSSKSSFLKENIIANTPLETMQKLYSLVNLFRNEFLMRLLDKTLDLVPQSADLSALSFANMC